ncbi:unnamed protein product, partial [Didymodactylos carnosus]
KFNNVNLLTFKQELTTMSSYVRKLCMFMYSKEEIINNIHRPDSDRVRLVTEATKRAFRLNENTYATFISQINEAKRQLKSDVERNRVMKYKHGGDGVGEHRDDNSDMNEQVGMDIRGL